MVFWANKVLIYCDTAKNVRHTVCLTFFICKITSNINFI